MKKKVENFQLCSAKRFNKIIFPDTKGSNRQT